MPASDHIRDFSDLTQQAHILFKTLSIGICKHRFSHFNDFVVYAKGNWSISKTTSYLTKSKIKNNLPNKDQQSTYTKQLKVGKSIYTV